MLIQPVLTEARLRGDIDAHAAQSGLRLWWLGQSGFLFQWQGWRILVDPYLSNSLTVKYQGTATPHVRLTAIPVAPHRLSGITAACISHHHTDHADAETLIPLMAANPGMQIVVPMATRELIAKRLYLSPDRLTGIDDGQALQLGNVTVSAIAAAHELVERDDRDRCVFLGFVFDFGGKMVYHSGDSVVYPGLAERLRSEKIDLALLPINGRGKGVAGNMSEDEAAELAREIGVRCTIPCHYDMFSFNTGSLVSFCSKALSRKVTVKILRCGEGYTLP